MSSYKPLLTSLEYEVKLENTIVGDCSVRVTYGPNCTEFDSVIQVDFIPHPIITTFKDIVVPDKFNPSIQANLKVDLDKQIIDLFNELASQLITLESKITFSLNEKKTSTYINIWSNVINFNMNITKDLIFSNKKIATIFPSQHTVHYPIDKSNGEIVSETYDIVNNKQLI